MATASASTEEDFLELRERLKQDIRNRMRQKQQQQQQDQNNSGNSLPLSATKLPRNDGYGSFFGPSLPSIAPRLIDECKGLLQNPTTPEGAEKVRVPPAKSKAEVVKEARDYSFLSSDDSAAPAESDSSGSSKLAMESGEQARPNSGCGPGNGLPSKGSEKQGVKLESRERFVSKNGKMTTKAHGLQPVRTAAQTQKYARDYSFLSSDDAEPQESDSSVVTSTDSGNQALSSTKSSQGPARLASQKEIVGRNVNRPVQSSGPKSLIRTPTAKPVQKLARATVEEARPKLKWLRRIGDEEEVDDEEISKLIRGMFKYNPRKYVRDDRDDFNMEANFHDIQKEERRSAKLAKKEDYEELQKIIEENKREMMMKKKLKK